jgi:hypothetical protein
MSGRAERGQKTLPGGRQPKRDQLRCCLAGLRRRFAGGSAA